MVDIIEIKPGIQQPDPSEPPVPNQDIVEQLRNMLADAESGKIQQLAVVIVDSSGRSQISGVGVSIGLIGGVAVLQNQLLHIHMAMVAHDLDAS